MEYTGKDNYGKPKSDFVNSLKEKSDAELLKLTQEYI